MDDEDMLKVLEKCYVVIHGRRNSCTSALSTATNYSQNGPVSGELSRHMRRHIFDTVSTRLTKMDGNLYDIIWPSVKKLPEDGAFRDALEQDLPLGIVAPDFYIYHVFREILEPILKSYNMIHVDLGKHPDTKFAEIADVEIEMDLDPGNKWIVAGCLEWTRNLENFEMPKSLTVNQLENVERILTNIFMGKDVTRALFPNDEKTGNGIYYTMNEILEDSSEIRIKLTENGLMIPIWNVPDSDRLHGKHWPYGRGVFVSKTGNLAAWINVLDHLRIITNTPASKPGNIGEIYSRMYKITRILDDKLTYRKDENFGFLSARPTVLGNTLQFKFTLKLTHLVKEPQNLEHLCQVRGLNCHRYNDTDLIRVNDQQTIGITEMQTFDDFTTAIANIMQLEKDLEMTNSLHIAAMFVNIFKKKKASIIAE